MLTLRNCRVDYQDEILPSVERARVAFVGSENGLCVITVPGERRRLSRVDKLSGVHAEVSGDLWTITGISEHLIKAVGLAEADAGVTLYVKAGKGCTTCP